MPSCTSCFAENRFHPGFNCFNCATPLAGSNTSTVTTAETVVRIQSPLPACEDASELRRVSPHKRYNYSMLKPTEKIWHNGRFIPWDDAKIHVLSHVTSYGSSVFEGIRCYATNSGPAIFRVREHIRRLLDSAKIYRIELKYGT